MVVMLICNAWMKMSLPTPNKGPKKRGRKTRYLCLRKRPSPGDWMLLVTEMAQPLGHQ